MKVQEPVIEPTREPELLLIALDCGKYAKTNNETFYRLRDVAARMARHRLIYSDSKHDLVGVFKIGSKTTHNRLADENKGGYRFIELAFPAIKCSPEAVQCLRLAEVEGKPYNFLDALEALGDYFSKFEAAAAKRKRLVLFTHAAAAGKEPSEDIISELEQICDLFREAQVQIDFICADWQEDIEEEDENDENENENGQPKPTTHFFDYAEDKSIPVVWPLARATGGYVLSIDEASSAVDRPEARAVRPTTRYRGTLDIGHDVKIPVKAFYTVSEKKKETAKKISWAASVTDERLVKVQVDTARMKSVSDTAPLDLDQIVPSYPYGSVLVPMNSADSDDKWGIYVACSLTTIGFISIDNIPQHWLMSPVTAVIPMPDVIEARVAMDALVHALDEDRKGILARWVPQLRGGTPIMAFLWPAIETDRETGAVKNRFLYCAELPLKEDLKNPPFPSFRKELAGLTENTAKAMDAFIECRMLDGALETRMKQEDTIVPDEDDEEEEEFDPINECNPGLDRFYCAVVQRALEGHEATELPPLTEWQKNLLDPSNLIPESRKEQAEKTLRELKIQLAVSKVPPKERSKRKEAEALSGTEASISDFLPPENDNGDELSYEPLGDEYLAGGSEW